VTKAIIDNNTIAMNVTNELATPTRRDVMARCDEREYMG